MDRVQIRFFGLALLVLFASFKAFALPNQNYTDVQKFIHDLAAAHPDTTKVFILGQGDTGDIIEGLQIGNGPVHNLVVATHHGNEYGSTEVAKSFATDVATNPIPGQTLFVIPVLNISGYNVNRREENSTDGNIWDANRDYPGPCGTDGPWHLKSTHMLAGFIDQQNIVVSATLHTFFPAVAYPWGISTQNTSTPYDNQFIQLGNNATTLSKYTVGNSTQVIYPADGCYEDYAFWKFGIWSLLFELGDTHTPDDSQVAELIRVNVPGLRQMFEGAPTTRAVDHEFHGKCDSSATKFDLRIE
jgi:carboxypeptidase T